MSAGPWRRKQAVGRDGSPGGAYLTVSRIEDDGANGRYLPLPGHVAISSGFEVIAAKRPAVRHFPAPTHVIPESPLLWRTVVPQLRIGSPTFGDGCPP